MIIPQSTYRLQLNSEFGFKQITEQIKYLKVLGASHVYLSPICQSTAGSDHGYDVVDQTQRNQQLGSDTDFKAFITNLKANGMSWILDVVPNHMAYDRQNMMLMDIFEYRECSKYFHFFDIQWEYSYPHYAGRVLAPFLGQIYAECLENGELGLRFGEQGLSVHYYDLSFPLYLNTYKTFLLHNIDRLESRLGEDHRDLFQYLGTVELFEIHADIKKNVLQHKIRHAKQMLWKLYLTVPTIKEFIDDNLSIFNGQAGQAISFDHLDELLSRQVYRLSFWKVASEEINYRRFFTINNMIALRSERQDVYDHTHVLIEKWFRTDGLTGLRIDHIDGLRDPEQYLHRLRNQYPEAYLIVEKILAEKETLSPVWPIAGTTGYDFLAWVNSLFCQYRNDKAFSKLYYKFSHLGNNYAQLFTDKKRLIMEKHMAGDVDLLTSRMKALSSRERYGRDITLYGLKLALIEVMAHFPVYRTYLTAISQTEQDMVFISQAIEQAVVSAPNLYYEIRYIESFLKLDFVKDLRSEEVELFWSIILRFQQINAPLMAKGIEDTLFYVYNKLVSLNEVGGDPSVFGKDTQSLHDFFKHRSVASPATMNTTATHDTKRGEDVRARINVLSELPDQWSNLIRDWQKMNRRQKRRVHGELAPSANDEYLLYQTLIGTWVDHETLTETYRERIQSYMIKAVREAKVHTAWIKTDEEYESACRHFIERILDEKESVKFLASFSEFTRLVTFYGYFNSLSQLLLKMTAPGLPDIYQGNELWDFHLVDPDNRQPVNFVHRQKVLMDLMQKEIDSQDDVWSALWCHVDSGWIKLWLTHKTLKARQDYCDTFLKGSYEPITVEGRLTEHIFAFARIHQQHVIIVVIPLFLTNVVRPPALPLKNFWDDTVIKLPSDVGTTWIDMLSNKRQRQLNAELNMIKLSDVFSDITVGLLLGSVEKRL